VHQNLCSQCCVVASPFMSCCPAFVAPDAPVGQESALFRFHPVLKEDAEVAVDSFARLQHVKTGYWLGNANYKHYESKQFASMRAQVRRADHDAERTPEQPLNVLCTPPPGVSLGLPQGEHSMESLTWDDAKLYQIATVVEPRYDDVYAIIPVVPNTLLDFNFLMSLLPVFDNFIRRTNNDQEITSDLSHADYVVHPRDGTWKTTSS